MAMEEPVPKGIKVSQPVIMDRVTSQTQQDIADHATAAGIPTKKEDILVDPLHVLEGVKQAGGELIGEGVHESGAFIQSAWEDIGGGVAEIHKGNRLARLGRPVQIVQERMRKGVRIGRFLEKLGLKKAA